MTKARVQRKRPDSAGLLFPGLILTTAATASVLTGASELLTGGGEYVIQNWREEQGLPQVSVTSIAQTPDGYLWLGTFNGLARFDGVSFTVFDEGNTRTLGNSGITQLQVDEQGTLWIVTVTGGLVRMAAGRFTQLLGENAKVLLVESELSSHATRRLLLLDRKGNWHQIKDGRLTPVEDANATQVANEVRFLFDNSGGTWIQNGSRIARSSETAVSVLVQESGSSNRLDLVVSCAAVSRSGGYWVGTGGGVHRLNQGVLSPRVAQLPSEVSQEFSLTEDGQGNPWASHWGKGIYRLDHSGGWGHFGAGTGLADNFTSCVFRDREGNLWIGTGQGGLHRFRPRVFQMYDAEGGASRVVMSVTQGRRGQMWFGINGGGLHCLAGEGLKPVTEPAPLRSYPLVYSVLADRQDAVWVGLYGMTALRWHGGTVSSYNLGDGSSREMTPRAFFEDHAGIIWAGCTHGLMRYDHGAFTRYTTGEGLSCDTVVTLAEDQSGTLYVGTDGGGLNCLRQGRVTVYTELDGLANNHLSSLYVDKEDTLWIGTANSGLSRFKEGRFATVNVQDGLPSNTIGALLEDDLQHLWLGSNRGLIRVSRQALNDYMDGTRQRPAWHVFGTSDGLSTLGCTGGGQPACCKAQDGKLWFATLKGAAMVDPRHLPFNPLPPPVVIEKLVIDDRVRVLNGAEASFTIPPGSHRIDFHFAGLSLVAPEKVQFRFRLDPFDRDWSHADTRRVASYTEVPPGRYRLRVTACNNDGVWNETGASLGLAILPPWWMTGWFRGLTVIGVAGALFGWYERRLRRLRRERLAQESFSRRLISSQESERRRIAGELHDGLGQDLLVIANQAQFSLAKEENSPGTAARLQDIAETAKHALQQARQIAHNLRPGLLDELGFTKALRANAQKAAQVSGLSIIINVEEVDRLLPPEFEVNLFRIAQEALNNVLKHAHASQAKVTLTHDPAVLRLVIEDNGRGFDPGLLESGSLDQRGLGVRQIAERAGIMGGRFDLQSRPGQGTRLAVQVPLREGKS